MVIYDCVISPFPLFRMLSHDAIDAEEAERHPRTAPQNSDYLAIAGRWSFCYLYLSFSLYLYLCLYLSLYVITSVSKTLKNCAPEFRLSGYSWLAAKRLGQLATMRLSPLSHIFSHSWNTLFCIHPESLSKYFLISKYSALRFGTQSILKTQNSSIYIKLDLNVIVVNYRSQQMYPFPLSRNIMILKWKLWGENQNLN